MNCTFDFDRFPYQYLNSSGTGNVTQGIRTSIALRKQPPVELCLFNTTRCLTHDNCCHETSFVNTSSSWVVPLITFALGWAVGLYILRSSGLKQRWNLSGAFGFGAMWSADDHQKRNAERKNRSQKSKYCFYIVAFLVALIYAASITATVMEAVIMPKSIQENLSPADRASQLAMSSFLTPVEEIFVFLEDTMTVKVGYAVAACNYSELNALLHIGVYGGMLSGLVAFIFTSFLAYNHQTAEMILNPSHQSNSIFIKDGCLLIPTTEMILSNAYTYWILSTLAWIPKFASKSIDGFLVGAGSILPMLSSTVVSATVPVSLWFILKDRMPALSALGWAYGVQDWIKASIFFLYFYCNVGLRKKYKLHCVGCCCNQSNKHKHNDYEHVKETTEEELEDGDEEIHISSSWKIVFTDVIKGGVQLMIVDLAVQLSITITIYLASTQSLATGYKLAAAQAAYWSFGPSYLVGINMMLKLIGSRLMGRGETKKYLLHFIYGFILTFCVSIGAIWLGVSQGSMLAYDFGESACIFLSQGSVCAELYANIFMGTDSLNDLMTFILGPTVGMQLFFMLIRAGLATCHDFAFMAKASVACFIVGYLPSIFYVHYVVGTASAYFIAMYSPHFLMILVFGWRMYTHALKILNDQEGTWSLHLTTMNRKRSESSLRAAVHVTCSDSLLDNVM